MTLQRSDTKSLTTIIAQTDNIEPLLEAVKAQDTAIANQTDTVEALLTNVKDQTDAVEALLTNVKDQTDTVEAKLQTVDDNTAAAEVTLNSIEVEIKKISSTTPSAVVTTSASAEQKSGTINIAAGVLYLAVGSTDETTYTINGKTLPANYIVDYPFLPPGYKYPAFVITGNVTILEIR